MADEGLAGIDELDRKILDIMQSAFPLCSRPYQKIAAKLASTEEMIIARVRFLYQTGFIRRLGVSVDSRRLGYIGALTAVQVDDDSIGRVADIVNGFAEVTHNYLRAGELNMWFTIIAPQQDRLNEILRIVGQTPGVRKILTLPARKIFKLNAVFSLTAENEYD